MSTFKPELIKRIRNHFNLNIYEAKVWLALLSRGIATAGEVAEISEVPRSRTYDVLESLEKQGFAISKIGKPVKYIAVKPTIILEKLKSNTMNDAKEKVETLSKLKEAPEYTELETLYKTSIQPINHADLSSAIKGKNNIYSHAREMLENAEKEIIVLEKAEKFDDKSRIFNGLFEKLRKADVKIKVALNGEENIIKKITSKLGIKAVKTDLNARFFIADRKQALLIINNPSTLEQEELAIWVNSDFFVNALSFLFDSAFKGK